MIKKRYNEEDSFLQGPRSRWKEFRYTLGVVAEFVKGFRTLHFLGPSITIFGSARFGEDHPYYIKTRTLAYQLAKQDFTIVTGGGPGIMEAANRGAQEAQGLSIGCNIVLPREQVPNPYLDKYVNFDFFFVRKELLRKYSFAFIVMPGGFGTLDEFFETLTLVQTGKTLEFPIVIMGKEYHQDLINHIHRMVEAKTISEQDLNLILLTDVIDEAVQHIVNFSKTSSSMKLYKKHKPSWLFGEKNLLHK